MADESEMVERVARAIHHAFRMGIPANGEMPTWDDPQFGEYRRDHYRSQARAAISAMREPTEAMVEACWPVYHVWGKDAPSPDSRPNAYADMQVKALEYWHVQIDAALNKGAHD